MTELRLSIAEAFLADQIGVGHALEIAKLPQSQRYAIRTEGHELIVEFTVCGRRFMGLNGGPKFVHNKAVSFVILTDDQAETDRLWNAIVSNGGQESACGWCKARWGFSSQITPRTLLAALKTPTAQLPSAR